jgi:farnesyl-diphosphate farnesyltransferase
MLPKNLNLTVTVAYLLCRIADTVEDEESLSKDEKQRYLALYAQIFTQKDKAKIIEFHECIATVPDHNKDVYLMKNVDRILSVFFSFTPEVQKLIGIWVVEMAMGMRKFAQSQNRRKFQFLRSFKDLDEYTYYVAGTVGHLLTALFAHFSHKITPGVVKRLDVFSESFGKGLQMVNIIRDMTNDLRRGQSYIPEEVLTKYKLTRRSIFEADNSEQAQRVFNEMIQIAVEHLDNALSYVVNIPIEETRIRLFCLLPLFWAMQTLVLIQKNTLVLLRSESVKISRSVIRIEFLKAIILAFSNRLTVHHYQKIRKSITALPAPA